MLENQAEELKLQELLKKKFPQLNTEEIEKISHQLMELGVFLVRLEIKKHSNSSLQSENTGGSEQNKNNSP